MGPGETSATVTTRAAGTKRPMWIPLYPIKRLHRMTLRSRPLGSEIILLYSPPGDRHKGKDHVRYSHSRHFVSRLIAKKAMVFERSSNQQRRFTVLSR